MGSEHELSRFASVGTRHGERMVDRTSTIEKERTRVPADEIGMKRPYVVCHMMGTVDGRIQTERWSLAPAAEAQYEAVHDLHRPDAWMCGRHTFQVDFLEQTRDAVFSRQAKVPAGDFIFDAAKSNMTPGKRSTRASKRTYAVAVDAHGKLRWESNDMRGDCLVVITSERASNGYLADLRTKLISYLLCGKPEINFSIALSKLHRHFGIKKLMLEGGGGLNGALLADGLMDELSLLVCPFADGSTELATVFDAPRAKLKKKATALRFMSATARPGGLVWLRYRAK